MKNLNVATRTVYASVLASIWTRPAQVGWMKKGPATDCKPPWVKSNQAQESDRLVWSGPMSSDGGWIWVDLSQIWASGSKWRKAKCSQIEAKEHQIVDRVRWLEF